MSFLREINFATITLRVVLSLFIGGCLGLERESKKQPAGFRTYMLVCLGATLVMMTNQYLCNYYDGSDPSRLGAQVVSGIGFLGAGTIMVTRDNQVRGLTTAAGLWSSACLGLAIGIGFYEGAIIVGIAILLIMTLFKKIDIKIVRNSKMIKLYINFASTYDFNTFMNYIGGNNIKVIDLQITNGDRSKNAMQDVIILVTLKSPKPISHSDLIQRISSLNGINNIKEV